MNKLKHWLKKHWLVLTIIVLLFALFFTIRYFIHSIRTSYSEGELHPMYYARHHQETSQSPQVRQATINDIQPWMTFDYVNVVFKLPNDYLKNIFGINDNRYPNIRIDTYARNYGIDPKLMLITIRKYISAYKSS